MKGQSEFAWIFSLVIGAMIIFLAIYFSGRFIESSTLQSDAELAREFDILLNPFSSIGSTTTMTLSKEVVMPYDMITEFSCDATQDYDVLGVKTKRGKKISEGVEYKIRNKYLFSKGFEGKSMWIFGKPLEIPWRVDDMIYIVPEKYCFINPPEDIKKEVEDLSSSMMEVGCNDGIPVCFSGGCKITVDYAKKTVKKDGETLYFAGDALMYAAIFSDNALYKCNVQRLMKRLSVQSDINLEKARLLDKEGCNTKALQSSLTSFKAAADKGFIFNIGDIYGEVKARNPSECPVF